MEIPPPSHVEVKVAIMRLVNNKSAGPDSLLAEGKYAQPLEPQCPLSYPEKGDPTICANYRGISHLSIAYKVTGILRERPKPFVKTLIGPYQC